MNSVSPSLPLASAFLAEAIGTFLLVWTVIMTAVSTKSIAGNLAPIAIGWSVALAHFVLVPLTGCGINPARSFGPMLVVIMAGEKAGLEGWWIYYTAPFVG
jgi:glycerol uptake facilitator-like aquaporin